MQTAVKSPVACALVAQFDLHTRLFNNVLDGLSEFDTSSRPKGVNHIKWIAGHLTTSRFALKGFADLNVSDPYEEFFAHGKSLSEDADYPTINAIRDLWNEISDTISAGLSRLPEEVLNGPAPARLPIGDDTLEGMLAFLMHHEAYHLGQMGLLRRQLGHEALTYG